MKKGISFAAFLGVVFLLSACGAEPEVPADDKAPRAVRTYNVRLRDFASVIEISGNLNAKSETTLASEVAGTVAEIPVKEGDFVRSGTPLLFFDTAESNARVNLETAQTALANAENLFRLVTEAGEGAEKSAALTVEQAEIALATAQKSNTSSGISNEEQIKSTEAAVETARMNLDLAKKSLADMETNLNKTEKDLLSTAENGYSAAEVLLLSAIQKSDEILGVTDQNKSANDGYAAYLSARNPTLLIDATHLFKTVSAEVSALHGAFAAAANLDEANALLARAVETTKETRKLLGLVDDILQNSITGSGFTQGDLSYLKATISSFKSAFEGQISALTTVSQGIADFVIQKPQTLESKALALQLAESAFAQAEANLANVKAALDVKDVGTSSQVEIAAKTLESAKFQFTNVQRQNEIAAQNARTARDNAAKQAETAALAYGRLTVQSPVAGVVVRSYATAGDTVNLGAPLFVIAEIDTLTLVSEVAADKAQNITVGMAANVFVADKPLEKPGKVISVAPAADSVTRKVKVEIAVDNAEQALFANTFVRAELLGTARTEVLAIPQDALISKNPPTVFVVENGTAIKRSLTLGERGDSLVEVLSGLTAGEVVIGENTLDLENGDQVEVAGEIDAAVSALAEEEADTTAE